MIRVIRRAISIRLGTGLPLAQAARDNTPEGTGFRGGRAGGLGKGVVDVDHQGSGSLETTVFDLVAQPARKSVPATMNSRRLLDPRSLWSMGSPLGMPFEVSIVAWPLPPKVESGRDIDSGDGSPEVYPRSEEALWLKSGVEFAQI